MPRAGGCIRAPNTVFIDYFMLFLWAVAKITPNERQMVDREGIAHLRPDFTGFERKPSLGDSEGWGGGGMNSL